MPIESYFFGSGEFFVFFLAIAAFILLDLYLTKQTTRNEYKASFKKNLLFSLGWIALALIFNAYIWMSHGPQQGLEFLTGYLIEKSLSVDNLFVFIIIFRQFHVPSSLQHRTLFYGMFGAIVFRLIMIFAGIELVTRFSWMIYIFGAILIAAGFKSLKSSPHASTNTSQGLITFLQRYFPLTSEFHGERFFVRLPPHNILTMTPLFLALITIEFSDIVFAIDSIPAILAITQDPYIVLTSNIFAILGLRSLYFVLNPLLEMFHHLHYGIGVVLIFVGIKFLISSVFHIPTLFSLCFIMASIALSILSSWLSKKNKRT